MRILRVAQEGYAAAHAAVRRTNLQDNPQAEAIVRDIIADVRARGDAALLELSRRFDAPNLTALEVPRTLWLEAEAQIPTELREAVLTAAGNITQFHEKQKRTGWMDTRSGCIVGQLVRPLDRVGVYAPGGTAVYPSTVLMTAVPARVAGVPEIVLCTPARHDGTVHPLVLYAAQVAGVQRVFAVGGAQAIAALAFGTQTIPAVDKIVGPGNIYVNLAKKLLWGITDMDMLAGPSEVCVVADDAANPVFVAMDLLTQAEHDTEAAAFLITPSESLAARVQDAIERQLSLLSRREILRQSLNNNGVILITTSLEQALDLANICAPEHLSLMVRDPLSVLGRVRNAGAILLGEYTPQTLGDYLAGPSHTLPTSGTARFASPLHVDTFLKKSSIIYYTREALGTVAPLLETFARAEGFDAHATAVTARQTTGN
ncbi:MAG: histidinol dehydrogenase [Chloroherpetonaceae bacterium]|nr:histidinol dehydrogenase [Chthonomonadaceae bacterium]MDW8208720.1 histidinol dehydrogenase [Chloroherpetonaceae bacterium]